MPVRDEGSARTPGRAWRQGTGREARSERSLPLRLRETLSRAAACARASSTVASGTTARGRTPHANVQVTVDLGGKTYLLNP